MKSTALASLALGLLACGKVQSELPDAPTDDVDAPVDPCAAPNVCECTAATQNADCGAHEVCDESGPGRRCVCAPAYAEQGGACVFAGAPLDPGFQDATKWTAVAANGAVVNIAAAGNVDPGEAVINRAGMCNGGGLKQTFTMPPLDRAEPLKISVTHALIDPNFDAFGIGASVGVGGQFFEFSSLRNTYRTDTACLGPRAFGGDVEFRVATNGAPACNGTSTATENIDHVRIEVAGPNECPAPNTVVNGDFENDAGWTFSPVQSATAQIVANAGENGTRGLRLATANRCSEATATGIIGLPARAQVPNPAIEVFWNGTANQRLTVQLGGRNTATIFTGNGASKRSRICVPDWAVGTTTNLGFFLQRVSNNGCTTALAKTFNLDSISIVNEPACAAVEVTDPGFERVSNVTGPQPGWGLTNGFVNDLEGSRAEVLNNQSLARTGNGVLRLVGANECVGVGDGGADLTFLVPAPAGNAGPAVKFFANVGVNNVKTTTRVQILGLPAFGGAPGVLDLPENGVYTQRTVCLPPTMVGRRVTMRFSTGDSDGGGCAANYPEEAAFIDDVEVTTDAACPAM